MRNKCLLSGLLVFSLLLLINQLHAQGGGPPMLTDDPGTPGNKVLEINSAIVTSFSHSTELALPLLDINYGIKDRLQLKVEMSHDVENDSAHWSGASFSNPLPGLKFRFYEDTAQSFSISTFPQISIPLVKDSEKQVKLPLQFEKHLGKWTLGEEIGYINLDYEKGYFFNGTLVGREFSPRFNAMGELYLLTDFSKNGNTRLFTNVGLRFEVTRWLVFMHSMGTQVLASHAERATFISYTGIQWVF